MNSRVADVKPENFLGGAKGDYNDPYTEKEYDTMCNNGTWTTGGYVDWGGDYGVGYCLSSVTCVGSSSFSYSSGMYLSYLNHTEAMNYINNMIMTDGRAGDDFGAASLGAGLAGAGFASIIFGIMGATAFFDRLYWESMRSQIQGTNNGIRLFQTMVTSSGGVPNNVIMCDIYQLP